MRDVQAHKAYLLACCTGDLLRHVHVYICLVNPMSLTRLKMVYVMLHLDEPMRFILPGFCLGQLL